jgi:3-dehydroquinate dehydratase-1
MKQDKVIDLRGRRMGGPTPLICSPLVARTPERLAAETAAVLAKRPDVIEWRVDFFEPIADTAAVPRRRAMRAAAGETPITTCRAQHEGGGHRARRRRHARLYDAVGGAGLVDLLDFEPPTRRCSYDARALA